MSGIGGRSQIALIRSLDELTGMLARRRGLYARCLLGPQVDLFREPSRRDGLTGIELPGPAADPVDVEDWWGERPLRTWAARRLYDYSHLPRVKGSRVKPWLLHGVESGRGPDKEPVGRDVQPLGRVDGK
ncbi:DUF6098 family protein [Streptomyces sp. NPDC085929]|uniref:DUF6098 family protein n=1 Tax=Streptomyces sp. NPDC085929 TaxID=3365739 RepID=UPI0037D09F17